MKFNRSFSAFAVLAALAVAPAASADLFAYTVTQNVGSLSLANPASADNFLFLSFQLTDGANSGNGNAEVNVYGLSLTGGAFAEPLTNLGNVTVNPNGSFKLDDGSAEFGGLADRTIKFRVTSADAVLKYTFLVDTKSAEIDTPDNFNVTFLDFDESALLTTGPGQNGFVNYTLTGDANRAPRGYTVDPAFAGRQSAAGDLRFTSLLTAPQIQAVPVPEPISIIALGAPTLAFLRRRKRA